MIRNAVFAGCAVFVMLGSACAQEASHPHGPVLDAENAWVRIPAPGRDMTAGYVSLTASDQGVRVIGAHSQEAETIELHTMAMDGDTMRMRRVDSFDVPAGETLELAPGGNHLMIFGLAEGALDDGEMDLTIDLADGAQIHIDLVAHAMDPNMMGGSEEDDHDHGHDH